MKKLIHLLCLCLMLTIGCAAADSYDVDLYYPDTAMASGVNGILTADSALLDTIEAFEDCTLPRGSVIVGHRGEYIFPNNSLPRSCWRRSLARPWWSRIPG